MINSEIALSFWDSVYWNALNRGLLYDVHFTVFLIFVYIKNVTF
jgi:hypothetical protein